MKGIGRGRAAGQEYVHRHELVDGPHNLEQLGHHDAGNLRLSAGVLDVSPVQNRFRPDGVAH